MRGRCAVASCSTCCGARRRTSSASRKRCAARSTRSAPRCPATARRVWAGTTGVLWRMERYELLADGNFWFSDTPGVPGSRTWGNTVTRICTWVRLRDRSSGRTVSAFNVHLDHESQPSRERSAAMLLARIALRGNDDPVLVTGDFNAGEANPAVAAMRTRFRDSYRTVHPSDSIAGTFHAFRGDSAGEKIDYVFVSPEWTVLGAAILRTSVAGRYPSDHFPVIARLRLSAAARP